jgi:tripartite-type tricarboxylate transporter receptor subunit TctC
MKTLPALLAATLLAAAPLQAAAQAFPSRPVSIVVPFGPGGTTDVLARVLGEEMAKVLGQPVVVVNKVGAAGTIGTIEVANAAKDGHTLGMLPVGPLTTQPNLRTQPYGPESFDYVCMVYSNPQLLLVGAEAPFKTYSDLVAYAKQNPGKLNYGSSGIGSVPHLAVVALANAAKVEMFHIPHKGEADALASILGGNIALFVSHPTFMTAQAGKLRALFVFAPARLPDHPGVPTIVEQGGPPLSFEVWGGIAAPKGIPAAALASLENACKIGTSAEAFRKRMETLQTPVKYLGGKAFGSFVASEFERNGRLLREAGMKKE